MLKRRVFHHAASLLLVLLLGGFSAVTLVRLAPGHNVDEELLDPNLSSASKQALLQARHNDESAFQSYLNSMRNLLHGNLGVSQSLGLPVAQLIRERAPVTIRLVLMGLLIGWSAALALVIGMTALRSGSCEVAAIVLSGALLSLPAAVLALLSVMWNVAGSMAIGLVVFPRVFRYAANLVESAYARPHITTARAKGLNGSRILLFHVVPVVGPQLLAVFGISVSMAVGAAIPIEALCGIAGIGQLAWQAALSRDLPVIVHITSTVALLTVMANSLADIAATASREPAV